jgi:hypothetical protein
LPIIVNVLQLYTKVAEACSTGISSFQSTLVMTLHETVIYPIRYTPTTYNLHATICLQQTAPCQLPHTNWTPQLSPYQRHTPPCTIPSAPCRLPLDSCHLPGCAMQTATLKRVYKADLLILIFFFLFSQDQNIKQVFY